MLSPALAKNIEFGYYPSGHMVYLNVDALKEFKHDLAGLLHGNRALDQSHATARTGEGFIPSPFSFLAPGLSVR